jgi:hypothetical protein
MTIIVPNTSKTGEQKFRCLKSGDWFYDPINDVYSKWSSNKKSKTKHHIFKCVETGIQWVPTKNETYYYYDFNKNDWFGNNTIETMTDGWLHNNLKIGNCFKNPNEITPKAIAKIKRRSLARIG